MNSSLRFFASSLTSIFLALGCLPASASINFISGASDINWYYESATDTWHTVFRNKGSTVATGNDQTFAGFTGIVGLPASAPTDVTFSNLTVQLGVSSTVDVGGTDFYVATASGSPFNPSPATADMGIRTRLRENEDAMGIGSITAANQFDSFNLTLNPLLSLFNGVALSTSSAYVSLLHWDAFNPVALINSETGALTANFSNYDHVHRNWGFSEIGEYQLAFDFQGVGGTYGATASTGSTTVNFNVTPEPSRALLLGIGLTSLILRRRR